MVATAQHIIAQSSNGSLFAVQSSSSNSSSSAVIRCYDGNVTNGSLKFTLRVPPSPSKKDASSSSAYNDDAASNTDPIRKLVFASPSSSSSSSSSSSKYLCALREYTILIYDLDRGVVSHTLNVRDDHSSGSSSSNRKSSIGGNEQNKAIVCDAALTDDDQLCVLVFFPSSSSEGGNSSGKCRIYQYDLAANAGATGQGGSSGLKRKIKVGSVSSSGSSGTSNDDELLPSFGVAVSSASSTSNNNKKGGSTSSSTRVIVIRMNDGIRVCDYQSGEKIGKAHIPLLESTTSGSTDDVGGGGLTLISSVRLSECSRYIVTASKNHITIFSVLRKTDDNDDEKKKKSSVKVVAQLSCNDNSKVSNVELVKTEDGGLNVLAFQPLAGTASLFTCDDLTSSSSFDSSSPPLLPKAQFQCDQGGSNHITLIHAAFHSRRPNEELLILFQNISSKKGGTSSNATLPMQSISYDNDATKGTVTVGTELAEEIANEGDNKKKKRKAADSVALASGEQGNEASLAMDLTSKKARKGKEIDEVGGSDDGDDFQIDNEDEEEGGEQGQSIAERLALLSSAMEESEDDEEDGDGDDNEQGGNATAETKKSKFKLKSATSETLTTLLTQALTSNDAVQLNIALQVTDRRLVEATVRSLQALDAERVQSSSAGYMSTLMGHIVRRMARRHSLVVPLGVWVKAILAATQRAATSRALQPNIGGDAEDHIVKEAREIALKLGPLRNFLNERVECFPQLLRLDGRLALLSEQL
jgi:hypothetical protein